MSLICLGGYIRILMVDENVVDHTENICRYLFQTGHFVASTGRVKYGGFLPAPNGQTSVFRTSDLTSEQVWDIGQQFVAIPRNLTLKGKADIIASQVFEENLLIEPDTNPHELHANIINWPEQRSEKILVAKKIAVKATLSTI